jgi:hypothetical protein
LVSKYSTQRCIGQSNSEATPLAAASAMTGRAMPEWS